jgi:predicted Mrr-cat superfamily restriction endonuclease
MSMAKQAFVLRISPSGRDRVDEALESDQIIIGWSQAQELLDAGLPWEHFREAIRAKYYMNEPNLRKAGNAAGHMWRFVREMNVGDLVVVPHGSEFYVAEIAGPATHRPDKSEEDTAFRRDVTWLNEKKPIPRVVAKSALISRMKTQGTCAYATDLLEAIGDALQSASGKSVPTFEEDLQNRLIRETLAEIRSGRMDSFGFERLIAAVLAGLGAEESRVIPRNQDKGADIVATFQVAGAFRQTVAVQAKHWQPSPPVGGDVVEQLIRGVEAESADLGMVITSGTISDEATHAAEQYFEDKGIKIEMVDGEQFSKLIVEHGIRTSQQSH